MAMVVGRTVVQFEHHIELRGADDSETAEWLLAGIQQSISRALRDGASLAVVDIKVEIHGPTTGILVDVPVEKEPKAAE